jgi:hypothetical protein
MTPWEYKAIALTVHDGDTFTVRLDLGDRIFRELEVRVAGIDAPELRKDGKPNPEGYVARDALHGLLDRRDWGDMTAVRSDLVVGDPVALMVRTHRTPTRGDEQALKRYVADVELPGLRDVSVGEAMLAVPGVVPVPHPKA